MWVDSVKPKEQLFLQILHYVEEKFEHTEN